MLTFVPYIIFGEESLQIFCPFFKCWVVYFPYVKLQEFFFMFWVQVLYQMWIFQIFSLRL